MDYMTHHFKTVHLNALLSFITKGSQSKEIKENWYI